MAWGVENSMPELQDVIDGAEGNLYLHSYFHNNIGANNYTFSQWYYRVENGITYELNGTHPGCTTDDSVTELVLKSELIGVYDKNNVPDKIYVISFTKEEFLEQMKPILREQKISKII